MQSATIVIGALKSDLPVPSENEDLLLLDWFSMRIKYALVI